MPCLSHTLPLALFLLAGCSDPAASSLDVVHTDASSDLTQDVVYPAGALIAVSAQSQVGVLLDDFPMDMRDRVAAAMIAQPAAFWQERARQQLRLTSVRLNFRAAYYPETDHKM